MHILLYLLFFILVSGFAYFQFYCFQSGTTNIPSLTSGLTDSNTVITFLNSTEGFAAAGCQFTNPLRDFFAANAPWYEYQKETWLVIGKTERDRERETDREEMLKYIHYALFSFSFFLYLLLFLLQVLLVH